MLPYKWCTACEEFQCRKCNKHEVTEDMAQLHQVQYHGYELSKEGGKLILTKQKGATHG